MTKYPQSPGRSLDAGFCSYGAGIMIPLLRDLGGELQGISSGDDIEYVHRSRVATRRLRAAIPLFSSCLPMKDQKRWNRGLKKITRSLGDARDLDVQIAFIREYLVQKRRDASPLPGVFSLSDEQNQAPLRETAVIVRHEERKEPRPGLIPRIRSLLSRRGNQACAKTSPALPGPVLASSPDPARPGLECLLLRLTQNRREIQPVLDSITKEIEESGIIGEMSEYLQELMVRSRLESKDKPGVSAYEQAFIRIMVQTGKLLWYEPCLADESRIHDHHAMRIAAKRLRYTLEIFSGLFDDELKREIRTMKRLQDLLGEIHDCDVWTGMLPGFLKEEEKRAQEYFGNLHFLTLIRPGIQDLIDNRRRERSRLFEELLETWNDLARDKFWEKLEGKISVPVQSAFKGEIGRGDEGEIIIALISDIHANLPALEAVLEDAKTRGASAVLNAGDTIGYGAFPDETVSLIRSSSVISVIGNYDQAVLRKRWKTKKFRDRKKHVAMRWAYHNLSSDNRVWLMGLPDRIRLRVRGKTVLVTHGSPDSMTEYLAEGTPQSRLEELARTASADLVITGHSHSPSAREVGGVWFVNCGSVGRPEDGDARACYALLTLNPFSLVHIRVPYDLTRAVAGIKNRHLPDAFARVISEGRPLEAVSADEEEE